MFFKYPYGRRNSRIVFYRTRIIPYGVCVCDFIVIIVIGTSYKKKSRLVTTRYLNFYHDNVRPRRVHECDRTPFSNRCRRIPLHGSSFTDRSDCRRNVRGRTFSGGPLAVSFTDTTRGGGAHGRGRFVNRQCRFRRKTVPETPASWPSVCRPTARVRLSVAGPSPAT